MDFSRRRFLGVEVLHQTMPLRPPWAQPETDFQHNCTRCGDCVAQCPEKILIQKTAASYPSVDFSRGECTFCGDCVEVCATTALNMNQTIAWPYQAQVSKRCLTEDNIVCFSCAEQCEVGAIDFAPSSTVSKPIINTNLCTGCGACVAPCPTQAIEVKA